MQKTSVLFGPYGTRLNELGRHHGITEAAHPLAVLDGTARRSLLQTVVEEHGRSGASVAAVNAFGLRGLLHEKGELGTYRQALSVHHRILQTTLRGISNLVRTTVTSLGPACDCYSPELAPGRSEAKDFHGPQAFEAGRLKTDLAWFETINTVGEGIGIAQAAKKFKVPCLISFVIGKSGKLLSGESVSEAIRAIDSHTNKYPVGYGLNCCPIEALEKALLNSGKNVGRILAIYPNASETSVETLNGLAETNGRVQTDFHPETTPRHLAYLARRYDLKIVGGCCGHSYKDIWHITQAVQARISGL